MIGRRVSDAVAQQRRRGRHGDRRDEQATAPPLPAQPVRHGTHQADRERLEAFAESDGAQLSGDGGGGGGAEGQRAVDPPQRRPAAHPGSPLHRRASLRAAHAAHRPHIEADAVPLLQPAAAAARADAGADAGATRRRDGGGVGVAAGGDPDDGQRRPDERDAAQPRPDAPADPQRGAAPRHLAGRRPSAVDQGAREPDELEGQP